MPPPGARARPRTAGSTARRPSAVGAVAEEEVGDGGENRSCSSNGGAQSSKKGRGGGGAGSSAAGVDYLKDREEQDVNKWLHQQQQNKKSCIPSIVGLLSIGDACKLKSFSKPRWKRVLLKIGGSVLAGEQSGNVSPKVIMLIAREVQDARSYGVQVAIIVGSQNIYHGDTWTAVTGIDRAATCPIRMMASVMNAMLLQASLEKICVETRVQTSFRMQDLAEPYIRQRAMRHLEKGRVVIFGGFDASMGNSLFTTDTSSALKASEINADAMLKGTCGVSAYGCHPGSNSDAAFEHISYRELAARGFSAMDATAITFCEENNVPAVLFNMLEPGNISRALCGDQVGTLVDRSGRIS